jgi:hypothetical protein
MKQTAVATVTKNVELVPLPMFKFEELKAMIAPKAKSEGSELKNSSC